MNDTTKDPRIISPELYAQLNLHQEKRGETKTSRSLEQNEASLREFNAELLERIGDFRKRNLELAAVENNLRLELAEICKREAAREREITSKYALEIESLKKALGESRLDNEKINEDWQRKFARMTDESWSKGLDISKLKEAFDQERSALQESKLALEDDLERTRSQVVDSQRRNERARVEQDEFYRSREERLLTTFDALKLDYERLSQDLKVATDTAAQLHAEVQRQTERHRTELVEQQTKLRADFVSEQNQLFSENARLKELLSVRDTRHAAESEALLRWRDQLSSLDSHLKGLSDLLKRGRAESLRAAKKVQDEIAFALEHPFVEYLEIANKEVEYIEKQIASASPLSPMKAKHESRLAEATSHRDAIRELMTAADSPLREHASTIGTLVKSLETSR